MSKQIIQTKFGSARLHERGYYVISCRNKNRGKALHRLIFEDHYKLTILEGNVIHHIDNNKTNNEISNLKLMSLSEHSKLHNAGTNHHKYGFKYSKETIQKMTGEKHPFYGKKHSEETKRKISQIQKGVKFSKEHREKIAKSSLGKHSKYTLWDPHKVIFDKRRCDGQKIRKCFILTYNVKQVRIGSFIDFITPTLIYEIIKEESK